MLTIPASYRRRPVTPARAEYVATNPPPLIIPALFARKANDADACKSRIHGVRRSLITPCRVGSFRAGRHGAPMIEFSLSIDLAKKERSNPHPTVDRAFIARALTTAAAEILDEHRYGPAVHQTAPARAGTIAD